MEDTREPRILTNGILPRSLPIEGNRIKRPLVHFSQEWERYIALPSDPWDIVLSTGCWTLAPTFLVSWVPMLPYYAQLVFCFVVLVLLMSLLVAWVYHHDLRFMIVTRLTLVLFGLIIGDTLW